MKKNYKLSIIFSTLLYGFSQPIVAIADNQESADSAMCKDPIQIISYMELSQGAAVKPPAGNLTGANQQGATSFQFNEYKKKISDYYDSCVSELKTALEHNDESAIVSLRKSINDSIESLESNRNRIMTFYVTNNKNIVDAQDLNENIRETIENLAKLSGIQSQLSKAPNWRTESFTQQFYAGLDANFFGGESSGSPKIGFLAYQRFGREIQNIREKYKTCQAGKNCGRAWFYMPHVYFSSSFTSAAEQTTEGDKPEPAFDWEIGLFQPIYVGRRGQKSSEIEELMFGLIFTRGGRQVDGEDGFLDRKYPGFRIAFNEEMYFDILKGKSEGVSDQRWEVRGQTPVSKIGPGRVFFGFNVNFGSFSDRKNNEDDSYKFYVTWQTSFDDLWSAKNVKSE